MFASSSGSFSASPALLLSQMSDPTALNTLCRPFLAGESVFPETFGLNAVETYLMPNLKSAISNRETEKFVSVPKLVRIIVDNVGEEGLSLVVEDLLPTIVMHYLNDPAHYAHNFQDLYLNVLSSIPSRFRDDVLCDIISDFSASTDFRLRVMAVQVITLVRKHSRVSAVFKALSLDRIVNVRVSVVGALPNCNFDAPLIEYVLTNATRDFSFHVRNAAASVFGSVAPKLVGPYLELLGNSSTMESALDSFCLVVEENGLEPLLNVFVCAIRAYPEKCARMIVECSKRIEMCEQRLLFRCAKMLRHLPEFIARLHQFSGAFETKRPFLKFFAIGRMRTWREKLLYAQQAVLFVEDLGCEMLEVAVEFADDSAACVREQSVKIFVALFNLDQTMADAIGTALRDNWHMRLVLAKVIAETKLPVAFWEAAKVLANDSVPNVREALANGILGTPYYEVFFAQEHSKDGQ